MNSPPSTEGNGEAGEGAERNEGSGGKAGEAGERTLGLIETRGRRRST